MQQQISTPPARPPAPARPVHPAQPRAYVAIVREVNRTRSRAQRLLKTVGGFLAEGAVQDALDAEQRLRAWLDTDEGRTYTLAVRAYNAEVLEYRRWHAAEQQAKQNEQQRQEVRAGMCQKCWTIHRPEVECE